MAARTILSLISLITIPINLFLAAEGYLARELGTLTQWCDE